MPTYQPLGNTPTTLKPAKRARYNRAHPDEAIIAASRLSLNDGHERYVVPTAFGWAVTRDKPGHISHYRVAGRACAMFLYDPKGE